MATETTKDAEASVRQYLLYIEDPSSLRDESEIQKKTQAVLDATDPIDKLKALAELERVAKIDEGPLREGFVTHAKDWAAAQSIPVKAFQELKVPDDVLQEAGFELPAAPARRGRRPGGPAASADGGRQRAKAVPVDAIKGWVLDQKGTFVLSDVQAGVGGSPATVRKAVEELVEAGQVEKLGPMADYQGRGRAPIQYSHS
jgi:hypothetical protein